MSGKIFPLYYIIVIFFLLFSYGCAALSAPTGGLRKRMEVEQLFESATLLPDHTYYIYGSDVEPEAIIAISNEFRLQTKLWSQRDWTAEELKKAVFWVEFVESDFCEAKGGVLLAPDGQEIGAWYSKRDIASVRQPSPGVVEVFPFRYRWGSPCERIERIDWRD
ncbi:MAG: hypothetical protein JKY62_02885 [Desulfocapsa sp.]|nr:hypothetical protein [Desulfocapsa sp.]MBN4048722.1 hypothetical protein [bacterium AH-315-N22]